MFTVVEVVPYGTVFQGVKLQSRSKLNNCEQHNNKMIITKLQIYIHHTKLLNISINMYI